MSDANELIDVLENKIDRLLNGLEILKKENQQLVQRLLNSEEKLKNEQLEVENWKSQFESLKIANTMLGSDNNKRETKLKINTLIREIDHCIGQLTE